MMFPILHVRMALNSALETYTPDPVQQTTLYSVLAEVAFQLHQARKITIASDGSWYK